MKSILLITLFYQAFTARLRLSGKTSISKKQIYPVNFPPLPQTNTSPLTAGNLIGGALPSTNCTLSLNHFQGRVEVTFAEFLREMRQKNAHLSSYEIKEIYRFLDNKNAGAFTLQRWVEFEHIFLHPFLSADKNKTCLLSPENLLVSLKNSTETSTLFQFIPKGYNETTFVQSISSSLATKELNGTNLSDYIFIRETFASFRTHNINGYLDKATFSSAVKAVFNSRVFDALDIEVLYRTSVSLMQEQTVYNDNTLNVLQFVEACRILKAFSVFEVNISDGWVTKREVMSRLDYGTVPSKLSKMMMHSFFDLYSNDRLGDEDTFSLRFENFAFLEFWANQFSSFSNQYSMLNQTQFTEIVISEYFPSKLWNYLLYSNFETKPFEAHSVNSTDYAFMTSFLEKEQNSLKSLFSASQQLNLEKLNISVNNYFKLFDTNDKNSLGFDDFILFLKYIEAYDTFSFNSTDPRGIHSTKQFANLGEIELILPLSLAEKKKMTNIDVLNCDFMDFLMFSDFMLTDRIFNNFLIERGSNYVSELNLKAQLRKMNLRSDFSGNKMFIAQGAVLNNYPFEAVVMLGLRNKCLSNSVIFRDNRQGAQTNQQ